ncbi:hypothetical protein ACIPUC_00655 [Streptomyces sp. LARHCF249]
MFKTIRTRRGLVGAAAALGMLAAAAAGGVAIADNSTIKAKAPHAQASALVNTDGSRLYSQGIKSLTRPQTGVYCVTFDDATQIKVDRSTPTATLFGNEGTSPWQYQIFLNTYPTTPCGKAADTLTVYTGNGSGPADSPFFLFVP